MSWNRSEPSGHQSGPSVNSNPSARTSTESPATSPESPASRRSETIAASAHAAHRGRRQPDRPEDADDPAAVVRMAPPGARVNGRAAGVGPEKSAVS